MCNYISYWSNARDRANNDIFIMTFIAIPVVVFKSSLKFNLLVNVSLSHVNSDNSQRQSRLASWNKITLPNSNGKKNKSLFFVVQSTELADYTINQFCFIERCELLYSYHYCFFTFASESSYFNVQITHAWHIYLCLTFAAKFPFEKKQFTFFSLAKP